MSEPKSNSSKSASSASSQAARFIEMQHQVRVNQADYREYLEDLSSWEEEMKKKEASLKTTSPPSQNKVILIALAFTMLLTQIFILFSL